jgi:hypothetical protein
LAFKSGGFVWDVLHFLKRQATTEKEEEQVNELPIRYRIIQTTMISISQHKTSALGFERKVTGTSAQIADQQFTL